MYLISHKIDTRWHASAKSNFKSYPDFLFYIHTSIRSCEKSYLIKLRYNNKNYYLWLWCINSSMKSLVPKPPSFPPSVASPSYLNPKHAHVQLVARLRPGDLWEYRFAVSLDSIRRKLWQSACAIKPPSLFFKALPFSGSNLVRDGPANASQ